MAGGDKTRLLLFLGAWFAATFAVALGMAYLVGREETGGWVVGVVLAAPLFPALFAKRIRLDKGETELHPLFRVLAGAVLVGGTLDDVVLEGLFWAVAIPVGLVYWRARRKPGFPTSGSVEPGDPERLSNYEKWWFPVTAVVLGGTTLAMAFALFLGLGDPRYPQSEQTITGIALMGVSLGAFWLAELVDTGRRPRP